MICDHCNRPRRNCPYRQWRIETQDYGGLRTYAACRLPVERYRIEQLAKKIVGKFGVDDHTQGAALPGMSMLIPGIGGGR